MYVLSAYSGHYHENLAAMCNLHDDICFYLGERVKYVFREKHKPVKLQFWAENFINYFIVKCWICETL